MNVIFFVWKEHIRSNTYSHTNLHKISLVHLATFISFSVFFYINFQFYNNSLLVMNSFFVISHLKLKYWLKKKFLLLILMQTNFKNVVFIFFSFFLVKRWFINSKTRVSPKRRIPKLKRELIWQLRWRINSTRGCHGWYFEYLSQRSVHRDVEWDFWNMCSIPLLESSSESHQK